LIPRSRPRSSPTTDPRRIKGDKIVEHWAVQDQLAMLQQLGFVPTLEAAQAR
jgi:hypothetical protein